MFLQVTMRIRSFCKNIEYHELEECYLKNCRVVIDGQNYFYNSYQASGLPFAFGCEADKYAQYLRDHLSMFQKANVKCYIVFKGGHADVKKNFEEKDKYLSGPTYEASDEYDDIVLPIFMKTVYKEVLNEMGIDHVMCEFESKKQCIALAQKLRCPIISFDIEFAFSGVPYIPHVPPLTFDSQRAAIQCGIFKLGNFMRKHGLSKEKLAFFIVLTDEKIFPELFFQSLFESERIFNQKPFKRNQELLKWLSKNSINGIIGKIFRTLSSEEQQKFEEEHTNICDMIGRIETPGEPVKYLMNGKSVSFEENDPCWFEKGVISNKIARSYVILYHADSYKGSWCIEDNEADDSLFFSIDLIKYAYNLLTNYQRDNLAFYNIKHEFQNVNVALTNSEPVRKPIYEAVNSPFENGWDGLKSMRLFDFFLEESLPDIHFADINNIPEDARLLMLSLIYFSRRKVVDTTREVYSILLSYVMLGVVFPKTGDNNEECTNPSNASKKDYVSVSDCHEAYSVLEPFFKLSRYELIEIFNRKLLHPFVEFQHLLQAMNNLNTLCGQCEFERTIVNKTYNGTFVYKFFYSLKNKSGADALLSIKKLLTPAPTVLDYFMSLVNVYERNKSKMS